MKTRPHLPVWLLSVAVLLLAPALASTSCDSSPAADVAPQASSAAGAVKAPTPPAVPNMATLENKSQLPLVPYPKKLTLKGGRLVLPENARIVVAADPLLPMGRVLANDLLTVTGRKLAVAAGKPSAGDIGLEIAPDLAGEAHKVVVSDRAIVQGGNYVGVGMGTVTLVQAISREGGTISLPRMVVEDQPFCRYTGMMVDIARQFNSIEVLKSCVMARLYKMKYLQFHMSDDQMFTFPSQKLPKLKGVYKIEDLRDLVHFADERGVTLVPEIEMPGHSSALAGAYPEFFGGNPINFFKPGCMENLKILVDEVCGVFKSSPFFHMGADEAFWPYFEADPLVVADRQKNKRGTQQQFGWFINEINKVVKANGKQLICWEGFGEPCVDKDVLVMEWDGRYFDPPGMAAAGYKMINVPWVPCIWATGRENYEWNMWLLGSQDRTPDQFRRAESPDKDPVIGGQMVLWECGGDSIIPQLRATAVPRHERIHSPDANKTYEDFDRRYQHEDELLDLLLHKFAVRPEGQTINTDKVFTKSLKLTLGPSPAVKGTIRYTLDGSMPKADSPAYTAPITLNASTKFNAQFFGEDGKPAGFPRLVNYSFRPLAASVKGVLPQERFRLNRYIEKVEVTLKSALPGEIRYTLDGKEPKADSTLYTGPVKIEGGTKSIRSALFVGGKKVGDEWGDGYTWLNYEKNITTGKPTVSGKGTGTNEPSTYETGVSLACDGLVEVDKHWGMSPFPCWLKIDLQKTVKLDEIRLICWWGDGRSYQYAIELSNDEKTWTKVVDASANTKETTEQGYDHKFAPTHARYIRVVMLKNSANIAVHIVEVRAYEAK
ncbi:MAG: family 20 glycosylhydrolase [Planctomycetota bacterium]|nr:family 20 glycosylhydrolase [Planctomycetota bacterium]